MIDKKIEAILNKFEVAHFEVAVVGGAVRDILQKKDVSDWDLATSAKPEEILKLFANKSFYNNRFGTVGIKVDGEVVEVTTYRKEQRYKDWRHPDVVVWGKSLDEDLARRDFTINAIALKLGARGQGSGVGKKQDIYTLVSIPNTLILVDPFDGQKDLKDKIIRTVGDPNKRFAEDALRLIRAVRLAITLGFEIEKNTRLAIIKNAKLIAKISGERVRDELFKIIDAENAYVGILLLCETGLLTHILPELDICFDVQQKSPKRHHIFDVGTHCVMSLKFCPSKKTIVRFATLLHDIGKAKVANVTEDGIRTFYNHEVVGGKQALVISTRFNFSKTAREKLFRLVRWHQFSVNENQTDKALRRFIRNVGLENVSDMMDLRVGDRLGGGLQQPESWRLKLFRKRLREVMVKPFTVADLKVDGHDVMKILGLGPGPKVGEVLKSLFEEVADDANKNNREYLLRRISQYKQLKRNSI
ncbi:hypothetical protein A3B51_02545 [Candidatus Curtissbacteria bacterium RIFCSPLOWO2_01_FULL_41_18]|uniref:HD domain-containing protein n=2 Tax=Candidatus Curtissiibacteriota TaxID=1752717 RepID=A0A1F5FZ08_9BACT|nr:MAG: hypothetical protein A2696_00890 [Candidatus Curtissbacteria bacterium RIFCSPHIGHO2_01_FULL_41_13]OGE05273.1 MAG: hypothetical protein A3B51_02545 [Candidatus Curtissbacteria bacterium RIFCSPLOWO2_01_FULL_41_18]